MLDSISTHSPWINIVLNIVNILVVLKLVQPVLDRKSHMKEQIKEKLNEGYHRDKLLLPEIKIRDDLLFQPISPITRIFCLKKFYTLFAESIMEFEMEKKIVRISNMKLESIINREKEEQYPSYPSRAKKTPEKYGLKKDDPKIYIGFNTPNVKNHIVEQELRNRFQENEMPK